MIFPSRSGSLAARSKVVRHERKTFGLARDRRDRRRRRKARR